jgi:hypothetical protein
VIVNLQASPLLKLKGSSGDIEVPVGTNVRALLSQLGVQESQQRYLLVYANGKKQGLSYVVQDHDALQLFLPIGGG